MTTWWTPTTWLSASAPHSCLCLRATTKSPARHMWMSSSKPLLSIMRASFQGPVSWRGPSMTMEEPLRNTGESKISGSEFSYKKSKKDENEAHNLGIIHWQWILAPRFIGAAAQPNRKTRNELIRRAWFNAEPVRNDGLIIIKIKRHYKDQQSPTGSQSLFKFYILHILCSFKLSVQWLKTQISDPQCMSAHDLDSQKMSQWWQPELWKAARPVTHHHEKSVFKWKMRLSSLLKAKC